MKSQWRIALVAASVLMAASMLVATSLAKDEPQYPEGASVQSFADHSFDLLVPTADEAKPPYSLLVVIATDQRAEPYYRPFARAGYVVAVPKRNMKGDVWSASESKDVTAIVEHLTRVMPIGNDRAHLLAVTDDYGFASLVAFDKRAKFVSFAVVNTRLTGMSPPPSARKRLGMLSMGFVEGEPYESVYPLTAKVRTIEVCRDESPFGLYYRYWLGVMEGRFTPGYDVSFPWFEDVPPPVTPPGEKEPPPRSALELAKAEARLTPAGAFVYFWSADDATKPEAKALQNDVFFDKGIRARGQALVAVKLERARYETAFQGFGLTTTPAVLVVDRSFRVLERFQGVVSVTELAKSLSAAANHPKSPK